MHIYICIYVYLHICMYMYVYVDTHTNTLVCIYILSVWVPYMLRIYIYIPHVCLLFVKHGNISESTFTLNPTAYKSLPSKKTVNQSTVRQNLPHSFISMQSNYGTHPNLRRIARSEPMYTDGCY